MHALHVRSCPSMCATRSASVDNITAGVRMIRRDTVTGERATYRHGCDVQAAEEDAAASLVAAC